MNTYQLHPTPLTSTSGVELRWFWYSSPYAQPVVSALGRYQLRESALLRIQFPSGLTGWGEFAPWPSAQLASVPSLLRVSAAFATKMDDVVLGEQQSHTSLSELHHAWVKGLSALATREFVGHPQVAKAAVYAFDTALCDVMARTLDMSVAHLLASYHGAAPAQDVSCATLALQQDTPALVAAAHTARQNGASAVKIKVGVLAADQDVERVRAVREAVGDGVKLRVDANSTWEYSQASDVMKRIHEFEIDYVESPLDTQDYADLTRLRKETGVAIVLDEDVIDAKIIADIAHSQAADGIVLKPTRVGGALATSELIRVAQSAGLAVYLGSLLEFAVGCALGLHTAAAFGLPGPHGVYNQELHQTDVASMPGPMNGTIHLPTKPGLGIEPDRSLLTEI